MSVIQTENEIIQSEWENEEMKQGNRKLKEKMTKNQQEHNQNMATLKNKVEARKYREKEKKNNTVIRELKNYRNY